MQINSSLLISLIFLSSLEFNVHFVKTISISKPKVVKRGRKKLKLCPDDIIALASIGCSLKDMATVLNCSKDTIERNYAIACEKGRSKMRNGIKRKQIEVAMDGSVPMLIWVGKQWCEQRDSRQEVEHKGEIPLIIKHFGSKEPRTWKAKKK